MGTKIHLKGHSSVRIVRGAGATARSPTFVPAPFTFNADVVCPRPEQHLGPASITFAMVGSQKCGTTTCYYEFNRHPHVFLDNIQRFFGPTVPRDIDRARADLDRRSKGKRIGGLMYPDYAMDNTAASMQEVFGPLKLLMLVRDPVRRVVSNYWMEVNRGNETRPIEEALRTNEPFRYHERGFYASHLRRLLRTFSREDILIVRTEDMHTNEGASFNAMLRHVGAGPLPPPYRRHHVGQYHYDLSPDLQTFLAEVYADANADLHQTFGVRVDDWLSA